MEDTYFPFLFVLPCGRLFLENNYFPICLCCPAGGFFWKVTISHFVCVALRAPSILKNRVFFIYTIFFTLQNCLICLVLSLGSMLERLVLKNGVECTSQRLKWTSGARVMTCSRLLGRSVGNHEELGSWEEYGVTGEAGPSL